MPSLKVQCGECRATGLYVGLMERDGEAVICVRCGGKGWVHLDYKEFTGRKRRNGVTKIRAGTGWITDNPNKAKWMTYEEFKQKIPDRG